MAIEIKDGKPERSNKDKVKYPIADLKEDQYFEIPFTADIYKSLESLTRYYKAKYPERIFCIRGSKKQNYIRLYRTK